METNYGKKVWWLCATDIEWIEVELAPKSQHIIDQERAIQNLKKKNELGNRGDKQSIKEEQFTLSSLEAKLKKDTEN